MHCSLQYTFRLFQGGNKKGEEKGGFYGFLAPSTQLLSGKLEYTKLWRERESFAGSGSRPKKRHTLKWFVWVRNVGKTYLQICFHFWPLYVGFLMLKNAPFFSPRPPTFRLFSFAFPFSSSISATSFFCQHNTHNSVSVLIELKWMSMVSISSIPLVNSKVLTQCWVFVY